MEWCYYNFYNFVFIFAGDKLLDVSYQSTSTTSEMDISVDESTSTSSPFLQAVDASRPSTSTSPPFLQAVDASRPSTSSQSKYPSTTSQASLSPQVIKHIKKLENCSDQKEAAISVVTEENRKLEQGMLKCFTVHQAQCLISGKPISRWQDTDVTNALALKSLGIKSYKYIRNVMNIPLPSVSTINRWISGINVEPGILNSVLRMMSQKSESFTLGQKACTLSFDEMKIDKKYCYDRGADRIYNPSNNVQVVMAQGILHKWVQPLYYSYDTKVTKELLTEIIKATEKAGYPVHGIVCDLSGANQGLLKSLGISMSCTSFENPQHPNRKVHVFADPPHMLKLVRNNLLDYGIETSFGFVNSDPLYEVIRYQKGDYKLTPRLSEENLTVSGPHRQKVKLAAHLLSESMVLALKQLAKKGILKSKNWEATSHFIDLVDKWFDLMNSSPNNVSKQSNNAFTSSEYQLNILSSVIEVFETAKVNDRVFPFMNGIVISSKSIHNIFADLKEMYSFRMLYTRRLNQDALEKSFGIIRQMGRGYEHPDPVSFKYRM